MEERKGIEKLRELIKDIRYCMMLTHYEDEMKGRPMATSEISDDGTLWFFTSSTTGKYDEIQNDGSVALSYADPDDNTYVIINGTAEISRDRNKMEELWNPAVKAWFPDGVNDPHLVLIKVTPHKAEYWDSSSSSMVVLYHMLKSIVSGRQYDEGQHGQITL
jgi:general stress protein 26